MKKLAILAVACAVLAGCATTRPGMSYVSSEISPTDARTLAADAAQHLAVPLPAAKTTIVLYPTGQRQDALTPAFTEALRATGFGVSIAPREKDAPAPDGVPVRYLVSPLDYGILMRLEYQHREAARFYVRATDGSLVKAAPFTVREATQ